MKSAPIMRASVARVCLLLLALVSVASVLMAQTGGTSIDTGDTIVGHVEVPAGESTANATVVAFPFGGGAGSARVIAKLDSAGNFKISGLQPGLYSVNASVPGLIPSPNPTAEARRFYRPGDTVNLPFTRAASSRGK